MTTSALPLFLGRQAKARRQTLPRIRRQKWPVKSLKKTNPGKSLLDPFIGKLRYIFPQNDASQTHRPPDLFRPILELGANSVGYNTDVRPILSDKCFLCHGPDKTNNKAGLRLDDEASAYAALKDTPGKHAIVPGSLENSEVWLRINSNDPDEVMPTPESNLVLTDSEKEIIASWIKQGAEYEPHWAFVPLPNKIPVPTANSVTG